MAQALGRAGKPVTLVKLPQEDHWLSRTETRVQLLKALESSCTTTSSGPPGSRT